MVDGASNSPSSCTAGLPMHDWQSGAGARLPYGAIVRHIRENLSRRITVGELARIARLDVFQLSRAFRREHATTPYHLVLEVRVRHAEAMLSAGATIAETALRAGFADQSHFTRHFKRFTGMTPKRYAADSATRADSHADH